MLCMQLIFMHNISYNCVHVGVHVYQMAMYHRKSPIEEFSRRSLCLPENGFAPREIIGLSSALNKVFYPYFKILNYLQMIGAY